MSNRRSSRTIGRSLLESMQPVFVWGPDNAFGVEESFIKGSEIDPVTAVFLFGDIATSCGEISLGYIAQVFDLGEQFGSGKHLKLAFHYY